MTDWLGPRGRHGGVDEIVLPDATGRLWLCGKHFIGPDPEHAVGQVDATTVVCLNERHELEDRYPHYVAWLEANRPDRAVWFPIPDLHAPELAALDAILAELLPRLERGERLIVHCGAGIGRAGTLATCVLISLGMGRDEALDRVAASRPMAGPEVGAQIELVNALAERAGRYI